jgi:hypothetical protein
MLVEKYFFRIWLKNVGSTFHRKMLQHFLKNVETFSNARVGGKIKKGSLYGFWWPGSSHRYPLFLMM